MKGTVHNAVRAHARYAGLCLLGVIAIAPVARGQDSTATPPAPAPTTGAAPTSGAAPTQYRTHTVRPGETLFDIAQAYLGDGDLWPEIYRLNSATIEDPHWIYTKEVLRIPAATGQQASAGPVEGIQPSPTPAAAPTTPAAPDQTTTAAAPAEEEPAATTGTTLFTHPPQHDMLFTSARVGASNAPRAPTHLDLRLGAPYLDREHGPRGAGMVLGSVDLSNVIDASDREHYDLDDKVYVTMPKGSTATVGERYYTFDLGASFGDPGQIVLPTGIVTIVQAGTANEASVARVSTLFGELRRNQGVLAVDETPLPVGSPAHVDDGLRTRVMWVEDSVVLPTMQYYVVIAASEKQGLHVGDQLTLYRPRVHLPESDVTLPESEIATAQVVRVNSYGATAVIISHVQPSIQAGVTARVTASMQ